MTAHSPARPGDHQIGANESPVSQAEWQAARLTAWIHSARPSAGGLIRVRAPAGDPIRQSAATSMARRSCGILHVRFTRCVTLALKIHSEMTHLRRLAHTFSDREPSLLGGSLPL